MTLHLSGYEHKLREAVQVFWSSRQLARQRQVRSGRSDQGQRADVTAGKNMDGFRALAVDIVRDNGLPGAEILFERRNLVLPGYFRPTKQWDLLVLNQGELVAALEFKSQVGPSFGNNFNNRTEEAIGVAHDLWTAYREGAFGPEAPKPFVGWFMLLEDEHHSRRPIQNPSPHFSAFPEFVGASYAERYRILCRKLVREGLYAAAAVILSPRSASTSGDYTEMGELTGVRTFVTRLAGHIAAEAARTA